MLELFADWKHIVQTTGDRENQQPITLPEQEYRPEHDRLGSKSASASTPNSGPARRGAPSTTVRAACPHDCPDTCALRVTVQDGRAVRVEGDPHHPPTAGVLCTKVARYLERTYHRGRLMYPLRRVGPKGSGRFEQASWDEALDAIAARLGQIAQHDAQRLLPYSYAGTMGFVQGEGMAQRFFHALGASLLDRTICSSPGIAGLVHTLGAPVGMDMERFADANLILLWGTNSITSNLHLWMRVQQAKRRGARLVAIDPYQSDTAQKCHTHLAIRPGTDAALALGMMHVLIEEGLVDREWVDRHTLGYEALAARAARYDPHRAAAICGVDADDLVALARDYGTIRPAAIRLNYGMQRTRGGGNAVRAVACLPALVGAWRDAAGGMLLSSSGHFPVDPGLTRPDLLAGRRPRTINMSTIGQALLAAEPPIEAIVVYNANPVAVAPESEKVIQGFRRDDLFTVVIEHFLTDTADHADWVLPATTQLEHFDLHKSYGHRYVLVNQPAIEPLGEALPNSEIFRRLAQRMGLDAPCLRDSDEQIARAALRWDDPRLAHADFETVCREGWARIEEGGAPGRDDPAQRAAFSDGGFPTPSGKVEFFSARLQAMGLDPVPDWIAPRESAEFDPALAARYPLAMISPPARHFLNSTFVNVDSLQAAERAPIVEVHPADAAARGIADAALVQVHNDRGAFMARARLSERTRPGLLTAWGIWWHKLAPGGRNVNAVTSQALTDLGRGPTFYDCLVEIRPQDGAGIDFDVAPREVTCGAAR